MNRIKSIAALCTLLLFAFSSAAQAQTTTFTYQGRLTDAATQANGVYDLGFALFDAPSGGTQIGAPQTRAAVGVVNGAFTVQLDFGAAAFPGADRYLEIAVKRPADANFTTLAPRQQVTATPYAVRALNATNADNAATATNAGNAASLGGAAASQFVQTGDARLSDSRAPAPGSGFYIQNQSSATAQAANFSIDGTGRANIFNAATQYNIGGNRFAGAAGNRTFVGFNAGGAMPTGNAITFVGENAGAVNTGARNSFFGVQAGAGNTTGANNSFFGTQSGLSNAEGGANSFFGNSAGAANTDGGGNSFFGADAGRGNTSGQLNSFFGLSVGLNNTTGSFNSFFGRLAGGGSTTGRFNTFYGYQSGFANQTGEANTAVGSNANFGASNLLFATAIGANATVGASDTIVLGKTAGTYLGAARPADAVVIPGNLTVGGMITGNINAGEYANLNASNITQGTLDFARLGVVPVAKGGTGSSTQNFVDLTTTQTVGGEKTFSSAVNTDAQYNIGGERVLSIVGDRNLFIGALTGRDNTTGILNTFVGAYAGTGNISGGNNAFFGTSAGTLNSSGSDNSFFGAATGIFNTIGSKNSFFGKGAGGINAGGNDNSFVGYDAGKFNSGSGNSFVGSETGRTNADGSNNTLVGAFAGVASDNLTFAAAYGSHARVAASDTIVLGKAAGTYTVNGVSGARPADTVRIPGNLIVGGAIQGASKNFKIDHPLDPLNKTLTYTSVESPEMKNIYDGNAVTDATGAATISLPAYFEALNRDFRYQLTVIGAFAQAIVSEKISGNQFKIKTDKPHVEVSWQVTGVRRDKFAEDRRQPVEQSKSAADKGKCLYAPACGEKERK